MFYKLRSLAAVGLFSFMAASLFPQTTKELPFETLISGTLADGEEQWFSIRAPQAGIVVVETLGSTDTCLEAYNDSNILIGANDDWEGDRNARLEIFAEAGMVLLFKLTEYAGIGGAYQIHAGFTAFSVSELQFGTWLPGTLREGEVQWFSIRPPQAGVVVVETSGNMDTYLEIFSSTGPLIGEDDDSGEGYNARLELFAEAGKIYIFRLSEFDDKGGSYQIRASQQSIPEEFVKNTERSQAVPIKLGEALPVFLLAPSESRWFSYDVTREGTTFIVQTRGNMDTTLALYDAQGRLLMDDDDSGEDGNALISGRLGAGTVFIEVKEYSGMTGYCTIHAETR